MMNEDVIGCLVWFAVVLAGVIYTGVRIERKP